MTKLADKLNRAGIKPRPKKLTEPLWKGPEVEGITQSLLGRFLVCRERFRLLVIEGLRPAPCFYAPTEYGNMWHIMEEEHANNSNRGILALTEYCKNLCQQYRMQQEQINHWYNMCKAQFPVYVEWWAKHKDVLDRKPLLQEQVFNVPYKLPSGRTVRLRGKWDSVDLIGKGKSAGIYLQENKTKSQIDAVQLTRQLSFDLQIMFYVVALREWVMSEPPIRLTKTLDWPYEHNISGVRYNVIRRSAHKTPESMLKKIGEDIAEGRGSEWFARWTVDITPADILKFREQCFDPILEQLCDWWDWITLSGRWIGEGLDSINPNPFGDRIHWRHPHGCYNILDEGGSSDLDEYLATGSEVGLERGGSLFGELE